MKTAEQIAEILFAHTTNNLATYADVIREAQLEAVKEGMRRAALYADDTTPAMVRRTIIQASEQLTIKDL